MLEGTGGEGTGQRVARPGSNELSRPLCCVVLFLCGRSRSHVLSAQPRAGREEARGIYRSVQRRVHTLLHHSSWCSRQF